MRRHGADHRFSLSVSMAEDRPPKADENREEVMGRGAGTQRGTLQRVPLGPGEYLIFESAIVDIPPVQTTKNDGLPDGMKRRAFLPLLGASMLRAAEIPER